MVCYRIGPFRGAALVVSVEHQACFWIIQMAGIDGQLFRGFIVGIGGVAKQLAISRQKRQRHEHPIPPQLPLAALAYSMPKTAIFGSWIGVEPGSYLVCSELILHILCFFEKQ